MSVQFYAVSVEYDGAGAEAAFLVNKPFVEDSTTVLVRRAEIEIPSVSDGCYDMAEKQREHLGVAPLLRCGYILAVGYRIAEIYYYSGGNMAVDACRVEFYIMREATAQQFYFLNSVYRSCVIAPRKQIYQNFPVFFPVVGFLDCDAGFFS